MRERSQTSSPLHRQNIAENRRLVAQVLRYLGIVLVAVAGTVFGLMVLAYLASSDSQYDRDWPGRYWFAVLPLLVAALGLKATGDKVENPPSAS